MNQDTFQLVHEVIQIGGSDGISCVKVTVVAHHKSLWHYFWHALADTDLQNENYPNATPSVCVYQHGISIIINFSMRNK